MRRQRYTSWNEEGRRAQFQQWRSALVEARGNITAAAAQLGFAKSYGMKLTRTHELTDFAAQLRRDHLGYERGRPWPNKKPRRQK